MGYRNRDAAGPEMNGACVLLEYPDVWQRFIAAGRDAKSLPF